MNSYFKLKIVAANRVVFNDNVTMAIIPAVEGSIGILKGHVDMLSLINLGILEVNIHNDIYEKYVVYKGICKIKNGDCDIVIRDSVKLGEIDKESLLTSISSTKSKLDDPLNEHKKKNLQHKLEYFELCLKNYTEKMKP